MKVVELMRTHIIKISPDATIADAVDMMDLYQLTSIPVVDSEGFALGVIEDRAIAEAVISSSASRNSSSGKSVATVKEQKVSSKMRSPAVTVDEDANVDDSIRLLITNDLMELPVTTNGKVTGRLSRIDVCQAILEGQM